ncbi:hypothetical protein GZ212_15420 [Mangrovimonas sp. CR14]|uniref:DUF6705 family protein n=1 Tax=Mangrovimonas sp. CR14 TaxID=2706120 RepID=UPI0014219836|nr:DUF6705 family protein [Mangrovimonas sp. CR14]NIK93549.1 hypothetical protein [Mangrovimonas sp. CR14]
MKNILCLITCIIGLASCSAQTPIVSRDSQIQGKSEGTYFKDLNNDFDKFVGIWVYINGGTTFTIQLLQKEMVYDGSEYYFDELFGEYNYLQNGTEIINTLPSLSQSPNNFDIRNIGGGHIITNEYYPECYDCSSNERRVMLYFNDPERGYLTTKMVLRYDTNSSNPEKMTVTIFESSSSMLPYEGAPDEHRVPYGEYEMIKQ